MMDMKHMGKWSQWGPLVTTHAFASWRPMSCAQQARRTDMIWYQRKDMACIAITCCDTVEVVDQGAGKAGEAN